MQAFAAAQGELAACVAREAALQMEFRQVVSSRPALFNVEEITLRERTLDSILSQIDQLERLREGLEARLDDERLRLVKARQDRETVGRLREIESAEHRRNADKVEQDAMDELATIRYGR